MQPKLVLLKQRTRARRRQATYPLSVAERLRKDVAVSSTRMDDDAQLRELGDGQALVVQAAGSNLKCWRCCDHHHVETLT